MPRRLFLILVTCLLSPNLHGETEPLDLPPSGESDYFLTPSFDLRVRYEFREQAPLDPSNAFTARARLGLLTRDLGGFSAFGELEATSALVDDYRSNPSDGSTHPHVPGNTVIADPENFELNQAWIQYKNSGLLTRIGRQHLVRNNGAFVGDTVWRQNLQTFDAVDLEYESGPWWFGYAYSDRVMRTFGADANDGPPGPPLRDLEGDFHFLDARYKTANMTISAYLYHLDVANSTAAGRTTNVGGIMDYDPWRMELAFQDGRSSFASGDGDYHAWYAHVTLTKQISGTMLLAGAEYLQENFRFPAGRLHAFNGFDDAFVLQRAGFSDAGGAYGGLGDLYLGAARPGLPGGLTGKAFLHWFLDDQFGKTYGYEADLAVEKKFNDHISSLLTGAWFFADEENGFSNIQQVTMEVNIKF